MQPKSVISADKAYKDYIEDETWQGCRTAMVLAIFLFPAFSLLDILTQIENIQVLSLIRFSTTSVFIILYFIFRKGSSSFRPSTVGIFLLSLASLSITWMCMILDGYKSPYYAGVNLVILAGVLLLPVGGRLMSVAVSLIISIYLVCVLAQDNFSLNETKILMNNMFFLISTGIIGVTASYFSERMRRESFYRYYEIKRSSEVLKTELLSHNDSIEGLAHEIIHKKAEAQNSLELRDQFISIASHELKTPLTSLKLQIDLSRKKSEKGLMDSDKNEWNCAL